MLQKWILGIMLATGITFAAVGSEDKNMAVGGWLQGGNSGEHAGLDLEFRHGAMNTLDLYTSFEFSKHDNSLGVYLGYYWHLYDVIPLPQQYGRMSLYFGPAAGMGWWQSDPVWRSARVSWAAGAGNSRSRSLWNFTSNSIRSENITTCGMMTIINPIGNCRTFMCASACASGFKS